MGIKIQLNNEAALRKLIADDPEFELEIKRAIATNLGNTYFKEVASSSPVYQALNDAKAMASKAAEDELLKEICDFRKTSWGTIETLKLKPDTIERIRQGVKACVDEIIQEQIKAALATLNIEAMVDSRVTAGISTTVRNLVQNKLAAVTASLL